MILDVNTLCSDAQDLAKVVGAYLSERSIDLGAAQTDSLSNTVPSDPGKSDIEILVKVTEDFVGATGTVMVELISADDAALTSGVTSLAQAPGGSVTVGIPIATLKAGYEFKLPELPAGISQRYLGFRYNIYTATQTAGKITAAIGVGTKQHGWHHVA